MLLRALLVCGTAMSKTERGASERPRSTSAVARGRSPMTRLLRALLSALLVRSASTLACSRRVILARAAAAATSATTLLPAFAEGRVEQRGAEYAYKNQAFGDEVCVSRALNGACQQTAPDRGESPEEKERKLKVLQIDRSDLQISEESDLVKRLKQKTLENAEANAREVKEKTIKAGQAGVYGPFSNEAPIMRADGSFDSVSIGKFERLKDRGVITKTATGLDTYVAGFDPDAPEPKQKFLGLF